MTQDEIISMAREAGFSDHYIGGMKYELERFAALVAAHEREKFLNKLDGVSEKVIYETVKEAVLAEREACAKVCDERADSYKYATDPWAHEHISEANTCAAAIRTRGENASS